MKSLIETFHHPEKYGKTLLKWGSLGVLIGIVGGFLGAGFHHALSFVTQTRGQYPWVLYLLPLGGLLTLGIYRWLGLKNNRGTNEVIDAVLNDGYVKPTIAPAIFLSTAITHFLGGSAGREGAALQLGGASASLLGRLFHLKENEQAIVTMAGMAAVFSGLFGTPLTATLFTMEFASVGTIFSPALLPCYLSALTASQLSAALGTHPETFPLAAASLTLVSGIQLVALAILVGIVGILMCFTLHEGEHLAKRLLPNSVVRIVVGALAVIGMTLLAGDQRYNGSGMEMAMQAVGGSAQWYDFLLKLLFTAVTLSAGFKGGEIVPTFCIGATFGCAAGGMLGLDPGLAGAMGLVGLFCCVTNSPLAAIALSVEMFGSSNLSMFALVCVIGFVVSGNWGLYSSQIIQFSKSRMVRRRFDTGEPVPPSQE